MRDAILNGNAAVCRCANRPPNAKQFLCHPIAGLAQKG
jgi:hypothetical protein